MNTSERSRCGEGASRTNLIQLDYHSLLDEFTQPLNPVFFLKLF